MQAKEVLQAVSFPVQLRDVFYKDVGGPGFQNYYPMKDRKAVVRLDTGKALSVVSDQYKLIPYQEVVEPLLEAIDKNGGGLVSRAIIGARGKSVRIEGEGKRIWIEAKFGQSIHIGNDEIVPRVVYGNSYDCSAAVRVITGFYQVKCTNAGALMVPGKIRGMGGSHSFRRHMGAGELRSDDVGNHLQEFLLGFDKQAENLKAMANSIVPIEDAKRILRESLGERAVLKRFGENTPVAQAWDLYAEITNHLTIDFKGGQQPAERRAYDALADILRVMR